MIYDEKQNSRGREKEREKKRERKREREREDGTKKSRSLMKKII